MRIGIVICICIQIYHNLSFTSTTGARTENETVIIFPDIYIYNASETSRHLIVEM